MHIPLTKANRALKDKFEGLKGVINKRKWEKKSWQNGLYIKGQKHYLFSFKTGKNGCFLQLIQKEKKKTKSSRVWHFTQPKK